MLKALIFDFDGLILDTETPEVLVWQSIYREHGFELPVDEWEKTIGGYGLSNFDAAEHLSLLSQRRLDPVSVHTRYRRESDLLIQASSLMQVRIAIIDEAREADKQDPMDSIYQHSWVDTH